MAALLASALAGALVAASLGGTYSLAAGVAVVQVLLLFGLVRSADVPAGRVSALLALVAGLASGAAVVLTANGAFDGAVLEPVLIAQGAGFVALVVVQLARRDGRDRLTASLTFGVTALLLTSAAVGWLALGGDTVGEAMLLLGLTGVAVAAAIMIFPGPGWLWVIGGTIGAASVGLILQAYIEPVDDANVGPLVAAVVSGAAGFAATIGVSAARKIRDDRRRAGQIAPVGVDHALLVCSLPVVLAVPAVVSAAWAYAEGWLT